jgi:predicted nuclease of predicted toxin-antitoxin system
MHGTPKRLVIIATGNISNNELLSLISTNLGTICAALASPSHLEISRTTLVQHP